MKNAVAVFLFILCFVNIMRADDVKYVNAMKSNFTMMDSMKTLEDMAEITNSFLRIAAAEKDKWLPYYYASYMFVISSFTDTVKNKKDEYLDEAVRILAIADSLQPDESENYVLKGLIGQARLQIDPMGRYMKYGQEMNANFTKAIALDPTNPRPEYLMGMTQYHKPEQFGGGPKVAKQTFENSLKKFNEFVPKDELMPHWGKTQVENFLKQIPQ